MMELSQQEMARDLLLQQKHLVQSYTLAETESANRHVRELFHHLHTQAESMHARLFHALHQRGWYRTPVAGVNAIEELLLTHEQKPLRRPELEANAGR